MQLGMDGSSRQVGNHALNFGARSKAGLTSRAAIRPGIHVRQVPISLQKPVETG
jgi:hypothetical protein